MRGGVDDAGENPWFCDRLWRPGAGADTEWWPAAEAGRWGAALVFLEPRLLALAVP